MKHHFIHAYCNTCHSLQGSSIKRPITIHEYNHPHVNRKWLYTAITRAIELNNICFMIEKSKDTINNKTLESYFKHKFIFKLQKARY